MSETVTGVPLKYKCFFETGCTLTVHLHEDGAYGFEVYSLKKDAWLDILIPPEQARALFTKLVRHEREVYA